MNQEQKDRELMNLMIQDEIKLFVQEHRSKIINRVLKKMRQLERDNPKEQKSEPESKLP